MTDDGRLILVLAHLHDHGAAAVARAIAARRGEDAVWYVSSGELGQPRRWTHAVDAGGDVCGELVLASGRRVASARVGCVLNRILNLTPPAFTRSDARERDYAAAEVQALTVSWLAGLRRPVVHTPGGVGPLAARSRRQWLAGAVRAGIPVAREVAATSPRLVPKELQSTLIAVGPLPESPGAAGQPVEARDSPTGDLWSVLVAGGCVHGPADAALAGRCVELARCAGCALLGLTFENVAGRPRLLDVDPFPALLDETSVRAAADLLDRLSGAPA